MQIVKPPRVKFAGKYLKRFRRLGIENRGFGKAANGSRKPASNATRHPLCKNRRIPFTRPPACFMLVPSQAYACRGRPLGRCPNPRRTQKLCSGTPDSSAQIAYPSPRRKRQGSVTPSLVIFLQRHGFAGGARCGCVILQIADGRKF